MSPANWGKLASTAWGRSELAAQLYDEILFNGATFGDLDRGHGPIILASATDLSTGSRFVFNQSTFDVICSDLNAVPLSRAASASSAVPVVLSAVTLNNYGGTCNRKRPAWTEPFLNAADPPRPAARAIRTLNSIENYGNSVDRPYLHLVDGGVADNLGMRSVLDTSTGERQGILRQREYHAAVKRAHPGTVMYPEFKRLLMQAGCIGYTARRSPERHVTQFGTQR